MKLKYILLKYGLWIGWLSVIAMKIIGVIALPWWLVLLPVLLWIVLVTVLFYVTFNYDIKSELISEFGGNRQNNLVFRLVRRKILSSHK